MSSPLVSGLLANGLEALVQRLQVGGMASITASWQSWFERAAWQLENDDSLDVRLSDAIAEKLAEASEALERGYDGSSSLHGLVSLYQQGQSVESRWSRRAQGLTWDQLQTVTFKDLQKALDAAEKKSFKLVRAWLDRVEQRLFSTWESYETSVVLPDEVTTESVLGHRYLSQGIEGWLEALAELRETLESGVDRVSVLGRAEAAQRFLLTMQIEQDQAPTKRALLALAAS